MSRRSLQSELSKFLNILSKSKSKSKSIKKFKKPDFSKLSRFSKGTKVRIYFKCDSKYNGEIGISKYNGEIGIVHINNELINYVQLSDWYCIKETESILFLTDKEYTIYSVMES